MPLPYEIRKVGELNYEFVNKDGVHGVLLSAAQNICAKNQVDSRKACKVESLMKFEEAKK